LKLNLLYLLKTNNMKKILCIAIAFISLNAKAQSKKSSSGVSAVKKGNVIIDGYYGFPNLYKTLYKALFNEANKNGDLGTNVKVIGIGPVGGNAQYLIEDKIGLLLDVNYMDFGVRWEDNFTGNNTNKSYFYDIKVSLIRAMVGGEYHFGASEKLDAFAGAKIGVTIGGVKFKTDDPAFTITNYAFGSYKRGVGVASRLYAGIRYFPIKPIGLFLEGGIMGGGIVRGGISIKI
jgi:hypothetical protein